ncbi:preprotein translocase subunit SecG [Bartonella sp. B41]
MQTVLIVIHFLVVIALVGVVLIQPSEGGGLGASSGSGLMRTRSTKNTLTHLTSILAVCFFTLSIGLTVVGNLSNSNSDILKRIPANLEQNSINGGNSGIIPSSNGEPQSTILEQLGGGEVPVQELNKFESPASENPVPLLPKDSIPDNK